jgi:glutathione S-transferase
MVDAALAPVFRYFEVFGALGVDGFFDGLPKVQAWRDALAARPSVKAAAHEHYAKLLSAFLVARGSELSRRIAVPA